MTCPTCGGDPILLGHLGSRAHYRCRACGWVWGEPIDAVPCEPGERIEFDADQEDDSDDEAPPEEP